MKYFIHNITGCAWQFIYVKIQSNQIVASASHIPLSKVLKTTTVSAAATVIIFIVIIMIIIIVHARLWSVKIRHYTNGNADTILTREQPNG